MMMRAVMTNGDDANDDMRRLIVVTIQFITMITTRTIISK